MLRGIGLSIIAALLLLVPPAHAWPVHGVAPLSGVNVNFGVDTGAGAGGSDLMTSFPITAFTINSTTCTGGLTTDFKIDPNTKAVVPSNTSGTYSAPTVVSGSYTAANDLMKESAINAHGSVNCTYSFSATANGTIPVSGTITILPTRSDIRFTSFDTGSINEFSKIIANAQPTTTSRQSLTRPDAVTVRTGTSIFTTQNTYWQWAPPNDNWATGGSGAITVTSEFPDNSTDANGNPTDGGGAVFGILRCSQFGGSNTNMNIVFSAVTFYNNFAGMLTTTGGSLFTTSTDCVGITWDHDRVVIGPAVTNTSFGGITPTYSDLVNPAIFSITNSHTVNASPGIGCNAGRTQAFQAGYQPTQCTVSGNVIETPTGDGIDLAYGGTILTNNLIFGPYICCGDHPDGTQFEVTGFGGTLTGATVTGNIWTRAEYVPGTGIATVTVNSGGSGATSACNGGNCLAFPPSSMTVLTGSGSSAALSPVTAGGAITSVRTTLGPSGVQGGVNFNIGDTFNLDGCCGGITGSSFTVATAGQGRQDFQGEFFNNSATGADTFTGGHSDNNLTLLTYVNAMSLGGNNGAMNNQSMSRNTVLQDVEAVTFGNIATSGPSTMSVNSGTNANLDRNLTNGLQTAANGINVISQGGTLSCYPSICSKITNASWSGGVATYTMGQDLTGSVTAGVTVVRVGGVSPIGYDVTATVQSITATTMTLNIAGSPGSYVGGGYLGGTGSQAIATSLATYWTYLPNFSTAAITHPNRAAYILATAPLLNGAAKNVDGTYNGWLFPPDHNNVISFNDGTVFNFNASHTPATNVPLPANDNDRLGLQQAG